MPNPVIKQTIDHQPLALVDRRSGEGLPHASFAQHRGEQLVGGLDGPLQAAEKPRDPTGGIRRSALGDFQLPVVLLAIGFDAG